MNSHDCNTCSEAVKSSSMQGQKLISNQYLVPTPSTKEINTHGGEHSRDYLNDVAEESKEILSRLSDMRELVLDFRAAYRREMAEATSQNVKRQHSIESEVSLHKG